VVRAGPVDAMFADWEGCPRLGQPRGPSSVAVPGLARSKLPLVVMITMVAARTMTALTMRNLAVFDADTSCRRLSVAIWIRRRWLIYVASGWNVHIVICKVLIRTTT
jgi:hypothetical protein